jgi:hypothetical protein
VVGDSVKPAGDRPPAPDLAGLARQGDKRRLESILRTVSVAEDSVADTEHQSVVPAQHQFKGSLVALLVEPFEELDIACTQGGAPGKQVAQMVQDWAQRLARHDLGHLSMRDSFSTI